ncbi:hypothetical protein ACFX2I_031237 [Malus domestica]
MESRLRAGVESPTKAESSREASLGPLEMTVLSLGSRRISGGNCKLADASPSPPPSTVAFTQYGIDEIFGGSQHQWVPPPPLHHWNGAYRNTYSTFQVQIVYNYLQK